AGEGAGPGVDGQFHFANRGVGDRGQLKDRLKTAADGIGDRIDDNHQGLGGALGLLAVLVGGDGAVGHGIGAGLGGHRGAGEAGDLAGRGIEGQALGQALDEVNRVGGRGQAVGAEVDDGGEGGRDGHMHVVGNGHGEDGVIRAVVVGGGEGHLGDSRRGGDAADDAGGGVDRQAGRKRAGVIAGGRTRGGDREAERRADHSGGGQIFVGDDRRNRIGNHGHDEGDDFAVERAGSVGDNDVVVGGIGSLHVGEREGGGGGGDIVDDGIAVLAPLVEDLGGAVGLDGEGGGGAGDFALPGRL